MRRGRGASLFAKMRERASQAGGNGTRRDAPEQQHPRAQLPLASPAAGAAPQAWQRAEGPAWLALQQQASPPAPPAVGGARAHSQ